MTTSEEDRQATRTLKQWVENERRVVTFRELSRELQCHVNKAKNILLAHHSTQPCTATYLISGPLLPTSQIVQTQLPPSTQAGGNGNGKSLAHLAGAGKPIKVVDMDEMSDDERNSEPELGDEEEGGVGNDLGAEDGLAGTLGLGIKREAGEGEYADLEEETEGVQRWGVVLVSEEGLEEKKSLFYENQANVHIYALSPAPVKDPGQYLLSNLNIRTKANYINPTIYGGYSGSGFKVPKQGMKDGGLDLATMGGSLAKGKNGPEKDKVVGKGKAVVEKQTASKPQEKDVLVKKEPEPSTSISVAKAATGRKAKTRVVRSDSEDEPASATALAVPKPNPGGGNRGSSPGEPTSSMVRADDKAAMEAMMGMDFDPDFDAEGGGEGEGSKSTDAKREEVRGGQKRVGGRKKRRVKKSKTEMNDKGYMVTADYSTDESYSGDSDTAPGKSTTTTKANSKAKPAPAPAPAPKTKPKPPLPSRGSSMSTSTDSVGVDKKPSISGTGPGALKKGGAGGQTSLQGFFKRK